MAKEQEIDRLRRENADLKLSQSQSVQTSAITSALEQFAISHYTPTRTTTSA